MVSFTPSVTPRLGYSPGSGPPETHQKLAWTLFSGTGLKEILVKEGHLAFDSIKTLRTSLPHFPLVLKMFIHLVAFVC